MRGGFYNMDFFKKDESSHGGAVLQHRFFLLSCRESSRPAPAAVTSWLKVEKLSNLEDLGSDARGGSDVYV